MIKHASSRLMNKVDQSLEILDIDMETKVLDFVMWLEEEVTTLTDNLLTDLREEAQEILKKAKEAVAPKTCETSHPAA